MQNVNWVFFCFGFSPYSRLSGPDLSHQKAQDSSSFHSTHSSSLGFSLMGKVVAIEGHKCL